MDPIVTDTSFLYVKSVPCGIWYLKILFWSLYESLAYISQTENRLSGKMYCNIVLIYWSHNRIDCLKVTAFGIGTRLSWAYWPWVCVVSVSSQIFLFFFSSSFSLIVCNFYVCISIFFSHLAALHLSCKICQWDISFICCQAKVVACLVSSRFQFLYFCRLQEFALWSFTLMEEPYSVDSMKV